MLSLVFSSISTEPSISNHPFSFFFTVALQLDVENGVRILSLCPSGHSI